ncbi:hypothetical protein LTR22_028222 [Elasticomyces elasticus]|nr:hypothetical protein LTR22_028222 [Elasticomyces elasticus]
MAAQSKHDRSEGSKRGLQKHGQELAETASERLSAEHVLAMAYKANGQIREAVELLEHVVAHELARAYRANGQIREAVELLEHVVAVQKEVLAEDHPSRLASQYALAGAYRINGQIREAVELLEHVVAVRKEVLAEDHPSRLASQHELARAYRANGQVKEAVRLMQYVISVKRKTMRPGHPSRMVSEQVLSQWIEEDSPAYQVAHHIRSSDTLEATRSRTNVDPVASSLSSLPSGHQNTLEHCRQPQLSRIDRFVHGFRNKRHS